MEELQLLKHKVRRDDLNLTEKWCITEQELEVENTFQDMVEGWREDNGTDDEACEWADEPAQREGGDIENDVDSENSSEIDWQEDLY